MHKFQIGDVVRVHSAWFNRIGIIISRTLPPDGWVIKMDDTEEHCWWLEDSLEFLGTETSLADKVLGDSYFA